MDLDNKIDIFEDDIISYGTDLLKILLKDRTTGKNIIWATNDYAELGELYLSTCEIELNAITGRNTKIIQPRITYADFLSEHWTRIRTNNVIERLNREIRRRTRVVGCFPDGNSALMLVCARLRHVAETQWGNKKYMNMKHLEAVLDDPSIAG